MNLRIIATCGLLCLVFLYTKTFGQIGTFKKSDTFFPASPKLLNEDIVSGYLSVPEDWNNLSSKNISIAVCILKKQSKSGHKNALVFIEGGPGASGIQDISAWLNHPLRKTNDIILIDVRGTGFSKPRLSTDLGKTILNILAKNQSASEDEKNKISAVLHTKQDLLNRGVLIKAYNSISVAKDIHALKSALGYTNWNVYGVSYGTYIAQVYASNYPKDIRNLILDSSISDIREYYVKNTSNYIKSLNKIFNNCKNDESCNLSYPNLEKVYYQVIKDLQSNPITVKVQPGLIQSPTFTYNAEDFKIAIQQALYRKKLIEIIPLAIYQFHERNESALGNLVSAFSGLINMDYGAYYCFSCNEILPNNNWATYKKDASKYKALMGGISFYGSDFQVCDAWREKESELTSSFYNLSNLSEFTFPVLILSGEYDPITPPSNGTDLARKFKYGHNIVAFTFGHAPGFSEIGNQLIEKFITSQDHIPDTNAYKKATKIKMAGNIIINSGMSKIGNSINEFNLIFILPLVAALLIMAVFIGVFILKLSKKRYYLFNDRIIRVLITLTSIIGLLTIFCIIYILITVASTNYLILAFGLPQKFELVLILPYVYSLLTFSTFLYFLISIKKISSRSILFSIIFSQLLLVTYISYWSFLAFI